MRRRRLALIGAVAVVTAVLLYGLHVHQRRSALATPPIARLLARGAHWREIARPFRAVQAYLRATQIDPDAAEAWAALADIAATAGQREHAQQAAERAIALRPDDAELQALRQRALGLAPPPSMRPGRPRAVTRRRCAAAQRLFKCGRVEDAVLALEAAAWLDERAARPYRDLANVYYLSGALSDAVTAQRAAVARAPQSVPLRRNLAALEAQLSAAMTPPPD